MLKKAIPILLILCLLSGISVMAENENPVNEDSVPEVSEQLPKNAEERPQEESTAGMPPSGDMQGRTQPNMSNGEMPPQGINRGQIPSDSFTPLQNNDINSGNQAATPQNGETSAENPQLPNGNRQFGGQMPGGFGGFPGNMQSFNGQTQEEAPMTFSGFIKTYSTPIISAILLALAFVFVIFYRRKNY